MRQQFTFRLRVFCFGASRFVMPETARAEREDHRPRRWQVKQAASVTGKPSAQTTNPTPAKLANGISTPTIVRGSRQNHWRRARAEIPERSLRRRFKAATDSTLIEYLQNMRIEKSKQLLEAGDLPIDEISAAVGYMDVSFFRRLFRRLTGLPPGQYRRMFQAIAA